MNPNLNPNPNPKPNPAPALDPDPNPNQVAQARATVDVFEGRLGESTAALGRKEAELAELKSQLLQLSQVEMESLAQSYGLYLPYISPISPLYLPYISPIHLASEDDVLHVRHLPYPSPYASTLAQALSLTLP